MYYIFFSLLYNETVPVAVVIDWGGGGLGGLEDPWEFIDTLVRPMSPVFEAQYPTVLVYATSPTTDEILMIRPHSTTANTACTIGQFEKKCFLRIILRYCDCITFLAYSSTMVDSGRLLFVTRTMIH